MIFNQESVLALINNSSTKQNAFYKKIKKNNIDITDKLKIKFNFNETSDRIHISNLNNNDIIYIDDINNNSDNRKLSPLVVNRKQNQKSLKYHKKRQYQSLKKNIYLKPKSSGKINFSNNEENRENIFNGM